jgi:hypothetical protein
MKKLSILLLFILLGCGVRRTEQTKLIDKLNSESFTASSDFLNYKNADFNFAYNKGYTYIKEPTQYGIKETFTQKNESVKNIKYIEVARYIDSVRYINIKTYKSTKIKNTKNEGVSSWVWIVGIISIITGLYLYLRKSTFCNNLISKTINKFSKKK